jgi:hypothetical protein
MNTSQVPVVKLRAKTVSQLHLAERTREEVSGSACAEEGLRDVLCSLLLSLGPEIANLFQRSSDSLT